MAFSGMDHNQLKDYIRTFKLGDCARGNQGYNRVLLQLIGYAGHGKSSFINSCKFVLDGEYKRIAKSGENQGGYTTQRRSYQLTETITIVDNRGFGIMAGSRALEVYSQLGNFLPLDMEVEWKEEFKDLMSRVEDADMDPNCTDFTVPIFVYSACNQLPEQEESQMKTFLETCRDMTGIYPIIVITKKTSGDYFKVEKMFKLCGAEVVFAIENYTQEQQLETRGRHEDILHILCNALKDVTFHMEKIRNPKQERIHHKKLLLEMVHKTVLEKAKNTVTVPNKPDNRGFFRLNWDYYKW